MNADILPEYHPKTMSGDDIAVAVSQMAKVIKDQQQQAATLEAKTNAAEAERQQAREQTAYEQRRDAVYARLCDRLEEKYGTGPRDRATELFADRIQNDPARAEPAEAALVLEECFERAKVEKARRKPDAPADTGGGGGYSFRNVEIKKGSLEEVAAQYERLA